MAIEFIVEDGTGKADATSYLTVSEFKQYWENKGEDYSATADADIQAALNIAAVFIDGLYPYSGTVETNTQALQFPRDGIFDRNGVERSGTVPPGVQSAAAEAGRYQVDGGDLFDIEDAIRSRSMGPISVTYAGEGTTGKKPAIAKRIERLLGDYVAQMRVTR